MMLVPQSLILIIEYMIDSHNHFPHSLESVYATAALLPMGFFCLVYLVNMMTSCNPPNSGSPSVANLVDQWTAAR